MGSVQTYPFMMFDKSNNKTYCHTISGDVCVCVCVCVVHLVIYSAETCVFLPVDFFSVCVYKPCNVDLFLMKDKTCIS